MFKLVIYLLSSLTHIALLVPKILGSLNSGNLLNFFDEKNQFNVEVVHLCQNLNPGLTSWIKEGSIMLGNF